MSVILDALRTKKEEEQKGGPTLPSGEGLFLGKGGFLKERPKKVAKKIWFLSGGLLLTLLLVAVFFQNLPEKAKPVEPMASVPAAPEQAMPEPETPAVPVTEAHELFQAGDLEESLKLFQEALKQNSEDPILHNDIGLVYLKKGLYASAEGHFQKSLELDQRCAECFNNLGYLKTLLEEGVEAEKYLQKALELNANYPDPYFNLGVLYEKNGDIGQAVKVFQKFLELKPDLSAELLAELRGHLKELTGQ